MKILYIIIAIVIITSLYFLLFFINFEKRVDITIPQVDNTETEREYGKYLDMLGTGCYNYDGMEVECKG